MQEDIERRTVAVSVTAGKLTGQVLAKALLAVLHKMQRITFQLGGQHRRTRAGERIEDDPARFNDTAHFTHHTKRFFGLVDALHQRGHGLTEYAGQDGSLAVGRHMSV